MRFVDMFIGDSQPSFEQNYRGSYFKKDLLHLETDKALKNFRSSLWDLGELYYARSRVAEQDSLRFIRNDVKVLLKLYQEDKVYDQKTPKIRPLAESVYAILQIPSVPLDNLAVYDVIVSDLETSALDTGLLLETSVDNNRTVLLLMRMSQMCPMTIDYYAATVPHHKSKVKLFLVYKKRNPEDKFLENVIQMKNGCENTCRKHVHDCPEPEARQPNRVVNKKRTRYHAGLNKRKFHIDISKKRDRKGAVAFDGQRREDKHPQFDPRSSVIAKPNRQSGSYGEDVAHEASHAIHFDCEGLRKLAMVGGIQQIENLDTKSLQPVLVSDHLFSSNRNLSRAAQEKAEMGIASWLLHRFPPREPYRPQQPHTAPLPGTTVAQTRQEFRRRMRERNFRIASMVHLRDVRHVPMCEAGLYLDEDDDVFRCYRCSLKVARTEWPVEEDPREVHRKLSPECPLVNPKAQDPPENSQEGQT